MSELLQLANALRRADTSVVSLALFNRRTSSTTPRDFFDLADALLHSRSVAAALATLPRSLAIGLQSLAAGESIDEATTRQLEERFLIYIEDGKPVIFGAVSNALATLGVIQNSPITTSADLAVSGEVLSGSFGSTIFASLQALTELLFEVEVREVREVRKGMVGLADVKRLAQHLKSDNEFAREIYELAQLSNLIALRSSVWRLTTNADNWVGWSQVERWRFLAQHFLDKLTPPALAEFKSLRKAGVSDISQLFALTFPFADSAVTNHVTQLQAAAKHLGLVERLAATNLLDDLLAGKLEGAAKAVGAMLPKTEDRVICQADLTIIAPGPLTTKTEMVLRRFVDTEALGLASTYRMTALSVSHGLETGLTESEIRDLLTKLSGRELPQPVDYLLREVSRKFGSLRVTFDPNQHRSHIWSDDEILLKQIENDTRIRHLSIRRDQTGTYESRLDSEVVYHALRGVGYTIVRSDQQGNILSPRQPLGSDSSVELSDPIELMLQTLTERDSKIELEPETDDRLRQIQLALKNKNQLEVTVITNAGDEVVFVLEPIGLANNRLRARDRKADIERTLPLDKILRVRLTT